MSSPIEFWFKDNKNYYLRLPVNPESVAVDSPFGLVTVNIDGLGEVAYAGERGLKSIQLSAFFPKFYNPSYCEYNNFRTPESLVGQFEYWRDSRRNIRLIVGGTNISIPVFIDSFSVDYERAGSPGDIYWSMTLKEYKPLLVREIVTTNTKVNQVASKQAQEARGSNDSKNVQPGVNYTVLPGDTLGLISKRAYGTTAQWNKIYEANKKTIGKNANIIVPGQKLVIPK